MSAFRISDEAWRNVTDAITDPGPFGDTIEGILKRDYPDIIRDWYAANDRAVAYRYGEELENMCPAMKLTPDIANQRVYVSSGNARKTAQENHTKLVQYMKSIQCLKYQCSESVRAEDHEKHEQSLAEIDTALRILGERLATSLPAYETAKWG